ncbi:response regulator [Isosphaeraceae bacterium EP7]
MNRPELLVVDDCESTRQVLGTIFRSLGWSVTLAATLAEGMAGLRQSPRCVILDLGLPDGAGESILKTVRFDMPHTRVAVCSGLDDPRRLSTVRDLKPDLMLWKPYELAPLMQLCEAALAAPA